MKKIKSREGITLIALVITIIVLLILAGVSINLVVGQNGVLNKAQEATVATNKAKLEEEVQFILSDWQTDYFVNKIPYEGRTATTPSGAKVTYAGGSLIVEDTSNQTYTTTFENGAMGELETGASNLPKESQAYKAMHPAIPTGFEHTEGEWNTGYVIKETTTGDEFVWIPVVSEASYARKSGKNNWSMSTETHGYATSGDVLQYVRGDQLGLGDSILGIAIDDTLKTPIVTDVVAPEAPVVNLAGGFYVSRYEVGIESNTRTTAQSGWTRNTIFSKKGCEPVRNINQTEALNLANTWKSGEANSTEKTVAYQSGLITGTEWDVMCNFIGWNIVDDDCTPWGNYYNTSGTIELINNKVGHMGTQTEYNNVQHTLWYVDTTVFTKAKNTRTVVTTGSFVTEDGRNTAHKNIYDVGGNAWEWTTEVPSNSKNTVADGHRVLRGGSTGDNGYERFITCRYGRYSASSDSYCDIGFRAVLYVKP